VAEARADLHEDAENVAAWKMFQQVMSRFTVDTHAVSTVLERLTSDMDGRTFADLLERFAILYDALCPAPERKPEA
jgi:hypothetical protein